MPPSGSGVSEYFEVSADGSRVVYDADEVTAGKIELSSVPVGGGASVRIDAVLPGGVGVLEFQINPNSNRVACRADKLYGVPIAGGAVVTLFARVQSNPL